MGSPQPQQKSQAANVVDLFPARVTVLVTDIPNKGRGVVAARRIAKGEVVETAPVVPIAREQRAHVERTVLDHYVYDWHDGSLAVALGNGSLFNHSYAPNAHYTKRFDDNAIEYRALVDIEAGDEITINYNGAPDDLTPLWFDVVG